VHRREKVLVGRAMMGRSDGAALLGGQAWRASGRSKCISEPPNFHHRRKVRMHEAAAAVAMAAGR